MSGGHCFRDTWHIFSGILRGSFTSAGESSVALWGVEGGESHGRAAPGDPELLKKADISLMYFTEAEGESARELVQIKNERQTRGQSSKRRVISEMWSVWIRGYGLKSVTALESCFKKMQESICKFCHLADSSVIIQMPSCTSVKRKHFSNITTWITYSIVTKMSWQHDLLKIIMKNYSSLVVYYCCYCYFCCISWAPAGGREWMWFSPAVYRHCGMGEQAQLELGNSRPKF